MIINAALIVTVDFHLLSKTININQEKLLIIFDYLIVRQATINFHPL